jgi:hypothetical protein
VGRVCKTYQQHNGNVKHEGAKTVQEESEQADVVNLVHRDLGHLPEKGNNTVHDSTNGSEVVHRDQGVHLVLGGAEESLDQVETDGLENDTADLEEKADPDELDLSERGNHDTNDNGRDVQQNLHVGLGDTHDPTGEKDSNRCGSLEHLNEGNTEVQIGQVAADQTQTEEYTDRHNSAQIDTASHLDSLAAVKEVSVASENLGHDRGERQVVRREDDGITEVEGVENPFVEQNDG